jgi:hypothetical protein
MRRFSAACVNGRKVARTIRKGGGIDDEANGPGGG